MAKNRITSKIYNIYASIILLYSGVARLLRASVWTVETCDGPPGNKAVKNFSFAYFAILQLHVRPVEQWLTVNSRTGNKYKPYSTTIQVRY